MVVIVCLAWWFYTISYTADYRTNLTAEWVSRLNVILYANKHNILPTVLADIIILFCLAKAILINKIFLSKASVHIMQLKTSVFHTLYCITYSFIFWWIYVNYHCFMHKSWCSQIAIHTCSLIIYHVLISQGSSCLKFATTHNLIVT